jgi:hypothetical protein
MALRWEARVRAAERIRYEATLLGRVLAAVGLSALWTQRSRLREQHLLAVAWGFVPRQVKLAAYGLVAAWLLAAVLTVVVLAALAGQL